MNRLRSLAAILLGPAEVDMEESVAALEAAGVPVSFADCRNCPHPCEEPGHEEYPQKIASMIDMSSEMLGSVKPYRRQVVISTGKSDWARSVTDEKDSLAAHLQAVEAATPSITPDNTEPGTPDSQLPSGKPIRTPMAGIFKDSAAWTVSILNGSHDTLSRSHAHDKETVLVFPDYKVVLDVPRSPEGARELWENSVNPAVPRMGSLAKSSVKSWIIPYSCVILISFSETLEREGWDVHTHLDDPTGPPLEDFNDSEEEKDAEMTRRLQELDDHLPKRALILKTSHIGGHRYAGNIIIYMPQGAGVWYGRVSTHEVEPIVHATILDGRILPPLLRGGVNLERPDCKRLNDW
ncbi:hypothetical protein EWM64_g53 [Hericium alpestre]|uniref:Uncharacterized protein n=1 Tax=Hericium alpestre TaxID=135208 RepID=A0A4Z0AC56_9AGAM|nr:hypothetical protein EWM64_g53 [Hericium alpestre]